MFCENCGANIPDTAKFCKYCGASQIPIASQEDSICDSSPVQENIQDSEGKKKRLIEYLNALYTAEMGVVYCDQLIQQLEEQKEDFQRRHAASFVPRRFQGTVTPHRNIIWEHEDELKLQREALQDELKYKKRRGLAYLLNPNAEDRMRKTWLENDIIRVQKLEQVTSAELNRRQKEEDQRYARDVETMEAMKKTFEKQEKLRKEVHQQQELAVCEEFDQSVQDIQAKKEDFCAQRDELYQQNLLYEKFRNPVAESQLRDYLEMGLVDRLEGSHGGYAFYLSELQSQQICGSIKELQVSMENRLDEISAKMSNMVKELHTANQRLRDLRSAVFDCCEAISKNQEVVTKMTDALKEEIAAQARPIREAVQRSEYNLYLEGMRKELDRYNYGRLKRPSSDLPR